MKTKEELKKEMRRRVREGSVVGRDLTDKIVLVKDIFGTKPGYKHRVFRAEHGFGCSPTSIGTAVFGEFVQRKIRMRIERHDVERILPAVVLRRQRGENVAIAFTESGETGFVIERRQFEGSKPKWVYFEPDTTTPAEPRFDTLDEVAEYLFADYGGEAAQEGQEKAA